MKKLLIYLNLIFFSLVISGCSEEFLERPPLDQLVETAFYKSQEDFERAVTAVYDVLQYQSVGEWAPYGYVQDILSDDSYAGGADSNDGREEDELNTFVISATNPMLQSIWERNYIGIYRANLVMEKLQEVNLDDAFEARAVAECKFLRAYFYFEQVKYFENIPLITSTIKSPSEFAQPQAEPKAVYDQIASDLVQAINEPELDFDPMEINNLGRVNKYAAEALLARVFLFYNGVYNQNLEATDASGSSVTIDAGAAVTYLEDIINSAYYSLTPSYDDIFHKPNEWGSESVFEIGHGDTPFWFDWGYTVGGEGNLGAQMQGPRVSGNSQILYDRGWSFGTVSQKLADDMAGDPRFNSTILTVDSLNEMHQGNASYRLTTGFQHTGYYSMKYSSDREHWGADGQFELNRTANFRVIRYADVLLMAAELGAANAQAYFDQVRARVGLTSLPVTQDNILAERRLEFALEGIRYMDLMRTQRYDELNFNYTEATKPPSYLEDAVLYNVSFPVATKGFLPIPQREIDLSQGRFSQNDGWN